MPLTEPQAKVLGTLAVVDPAEARTVRQLSNTTEFGTGRTRAALLRLSNLGLVLGTSGIPTQYWISAQGRALMRTRMYRDFVPDSAASHRKGA
ncbi:hypothetical protein [Nocardia sp. NPDC052566]|uniref:hypothetical protein n=1 Tax=Nocardia sp. NPDC052566 TaxID=3364330 RepID=UPI0037C780FC